MSARPAMAKPTSKVLVINDEPLILKELLKGLNAAARSLDNPFGISFTGALTAKEGLALIERDGDIQVVIVDDKLYAVEDGPRRQQRNGSRNGKTPPGREPSRTLQVSALKLVQKITALRPELDLYILIEKEREDEVVDTLFAEAVDGYFYREERDYRGMYRILNAQIAERARTPFYDALCAYVLAAKDAWHTPGHSSGDSLRGSPWVNDFYEFNQAREDDFERREERRFVNELINDDPDFWREIGLKRERKPSAHQPIQNSERVA